MLLLTSHYLYIIFLKRMNKNVPVPFSVFGITDANKNLN